MTRATIRSGLALIAVASALAGCASEPPSGQGANVEIRGTDPTAAPTPTTPPTPEQAVAPADPNGILTYDGYQSILARDGDTVADVAARVDLSASALGAYNGLPSDYQMNAGDELVLPPRPGGYGTQGTAVALNAPAQTDGPIEDRPLDGAAASSVPDAAEDVGQPSWSPAIAAEALDRSTGLQDDGTLLAPPSANEPVPPAPTEARPLQSPDLSQYQTGSVGEQASPEPQATLTETSPPAATGPAFTVIRPVDGPIAIAFNKSSGGARNDGVDFDAPAGTTVRAAADGEVALVSPSLGGLGTIVLIRHRDGYLTVYGRVDGVSAVKGDQVTAGQQIGVVAAPTGGDPARMHFEVRNGATSLNPEEYFAQG